MEILFSSVAINFAREFPTRNPPMAGAFIAAASIASNCSWS
jgi:hypothetical protein